MTDIRNWQPGDLPALAEIRQAAHPFDLDNLLALTPDAIRHEIERPGLDPARDVFVAGSGDGRVGGLSMFRGSTARTTPWAFA